MNRLFCIVFASISITLLPAVASAQVIDCACDSEYSVGDRVTLLVDNPDGAISLPAGSVGTVLCGDNGSTYDLYISWDNWADGHDLTNYCDCQSGDDVEDSSHWLVQCADVRHGEPGLIEVPGDYATIQEAMNESIDGDTIQIAAGTYYENSLRVWGRAVTISGAMDPDGNPTTIVDGEDAGTVFYFEDGETNSTRLENIVIQNGFYSGNGGGVYVDDSEPWFANCTFRSNTAINGGGVFLVDTYNVKFEGCRFVDNQASDSGGGLYAGSHTYFQLWDSTFDGNSASSGGGACVYSTNHQAVIHDTEFVDNVAEYGGGLYAYWVVMNMVGNVFRDNVAGELGGGIYLVQCDAWIQSSQIVGNSAPSGAGMYFNGDWGTSVTGTSFEGNVATLDGGGLITYYTNEPLYLFDCTFMGNQAEIGGGMYSYWSGSELSNCTFNGNLATVEGGGIWGYAGTSTLSSCTFRGNSAMASDFSGCRGGGICNVSHESTMVGCTIEDNTSGSGGGIYNESSDLVLEDCTVSSNVGKVCGGGMFSEDSIAWLAETTFCANQPDNIIGAWVDQGDNVLSPDCGPDDPGFCVGDANIDYNVDILDLLYVIAVWNTDNAAGDINEDGWVDILDLLEVLSNWGQCNEA